MAGGTGLGGAPPPVAGTAAGSGRAVAGGGGIGGSGGSTMASGGSIPSDGTGGAIVASGGTAASGVGGATTSMGGADGATIASDFVASESDFECLAHWTKVRSFYIANKVGYLSGALAVANASNGKYPVGTIIQLIPNEAMVKRATGFSPSSDDWEFFSLNTSASGTQIVQRGTTSVVNAFNLNCLACHQKAQPQYDFVCETNHGCDPLPLTPQIIDSLQTSDPRCP